MTTRGSNIAAMAATFAIGFAAGVLVAPMSGNRTRRFIGLKARRKLIHAERKLDAIEAQLTDLNARMGEVTGDLRGWLQEAARDRVDQHLPDLSLPNEKWDLDDNDMKRELRHIAR